MDSSVTMGSSSSYFFLPLFREFPDAVECSLEEDGEEAWAVAIAGEPVEGRDCGDSMLKETSVSWSENIEMSELTE